MYVAFCFGAKLAILAATNGFYTSKNLDSTTYDSRQHFRKYISKAFYCFMLCHAFVNAPGTTYSTPSLLGQNFDRLIQNLEICKI